MEKNTFDLKNCENVKMTLIGSKIQGKAYSMAGQNCFMVLWNLSVNFFLFVQFISLCIIFLWDWLIVKPKTSISLSIWEPFGSRRTITIFYDLVVIEWVLLWALSNFKNYRSIWVSQIVFTAFIKKRYLWPIYIPTPLGFWYYMYQNP